MKLALIAFTLLFIAGPSVAFTDDLEDAYQNLKSAEEKNDAALLKEVAMATYAVAKREGGMPAPMGDSEMEYWTKRMDAVRKVELRTEYALFRAAGAGGPAVAVELLAALERLNPKSRYLDEGYGTYFVALTQTGGAGKIAGIAEKALAHFPENEDLLLVLANEAMTRRQVDRELALSERLVAAMSRHGKPEGYTAAGWEKKKRAALARGYWMCGIAHSEKQQFFEADKDLRAALPLIEGNAAMQAPAYFHLGVANYQLGKMTNNKQRVLEGVKFSEMAVGMKGPFSEQAWRNAQIMRAEAGRMR